MVCFSNRLVISIIFTTFIIKLTCTDNSDENKYDIY